MLLYIDVHKAPFFKKHYDLEGKQYFYFFVRNQIQKFEEFQDLIGKPDLLQQTLKFTSTVINSISIEIQSL